MSPMPMMWYRACFGMLHGVQLLISWVDRCGVVVGQLVGYSLCSLLSSTIGSWWCTAGWVLWPALLDGVGHRSWMKVGCPVGAGVCILVRIVNGIAGWIVSWLFDWLDSWCFGGATGRLKGCRPGSELCGLQLLATTVTIHGHCVVRGVRGLQLLAMTVSPLPLSSLSKRIWKGLLCRVRRWCIIGGWRMVFGAVMVLDVVATLRGAATGTLGGVAGTTLGDVGLGGGGVLGRPDMIVVSRKNCVKMFQLGGGHIWDCTSQ